MNTAKLAKRVPTFIMIAFLTYASYSVHASLPDSAADGKNLANGLDVMMKDVLHASADEAKSLTNVVFRDPFQTSHKLTDAPKPQKADTADDSELDPLTEVVKGLWLDATFLQGQTQIAIINGLTYHRGQHLIEQADTAELTCPCSFRACERRPSLRVRARLTSWDIPISSVIRLGEITLGTQKPLTDQ